jgi:type I restriction enzyme R subunit
MKRIILTGGGTAGHVTPNIALLPRLKELEYDIHYIGSYNGIEKELIEQFLQRINAENYQTSDILEDWKVFVLEQKEKDISSLIDEEKLKPEETRKFVDNALKYGTLKTTGTDIDKILPPVSRFGGGRDKKKQTVIDKLRVFFERYFGLVNTAESFS